MRVDVVIFYTAEARSARAAGDAAYTRVGKARVQDGGFRKKNI
jgi:hypothetical protein